MIGLMIGLVILGGLLFGGGLSLVIVSDSEDIGAVIAGGVSSAFGIVLAVLALGAL